MQNLFVCLPECSQCFWWTLQLNSPSVTGFLRLNQNSTWKKCCNENSHSVRAVLTLTLLTFLGSVLQGSGKVFHSPDIIGGGVVRPREAVWSSHICAAVPAPPQGPWGGCVSDNYFCPWLFLLTHLILNGVFFLKNSSVHVFIQISSKCLENHMAAGGGGLPEA